MTEEPGQDSGQPPPGLSWGELVGQLVATHGTLAAVAWKLIEKGDDVASIERALRRLRSRGQQDGGVWGQRVLRVFGLPRTIEDRLRWMGLYHSPFNDLPLALCLDQLRIWDRPPVSESRARVWLQLGYASCALRGRDFAAAETALLGIGLAPPAGAGAAHLEHLLASAYLASRTGGDAAAILDQVSIPDGLPAADHACFVARLVDQRAFQRNRHDPADALALYAALPDADVHPFASYRRDAGRAWGHYRAGDRPRAAALAHRAVDHAGDGGYTRLRAMGLLLLSTVTADLAYLARARAIATRLGDAELLARCARRAASGP